MPRAVLFERVKRIYPGGIEALGGIDLAIDEGDFVAILGPSGCGKSTLLRLVAGLDRADAGSVTARGDAGRGEVGFVFQEASLLPWRPVLRNVELPLELRGVASRERHARAMEALAAVQLGDVAHLYPDQLSGGMRMRVSIARALATGARLLLLDEPFAALDEITRHALDDRLRALWASRGMTVLFVTHAIHEAVFLANRVLVMSKRPGRIVHDKTIDLPRERTLAMRGEARFAEQAAALYEALARGDAS